MDEMQRLSHGDLQRRRWLLVLAASPWMVAAPRAQDAPWHALAAGGAALLLRHGLTDPGVGDPPDFRLGQCGTQRNLSAAGRAQSSRIGAALRSRGVVFDQVLSSAWCRCVDTATLVAPTAEVRVFQALNSTFNDRALEPAQTAAVRRFLQELQAPRRVLMVTHQVNIGALTGHSVAMGEGLVVQGTPTGVVVRGRLALGS